MALSMPKHSRVIALTLWLISYLAMMYLFMTIMMLVPKNKISICTTSLEILEKNPFIYLPFSHLKKLRALTHSTSNSH